MSVRGKALSGLNKSKEIIEKMSASPKFKFPYEAYPIQLNFMESLYNAISNRKICFLESPTGTGKSMSVACAIGKWLEDQTILRNNDFDSYVRNNYRNAESSIVNNHKNNPSWLRSQIAEAKNRNTELPENRYMKGMTKLDPSMLVKLKLQSMCKNPAKIYYCSRTTQQLNQFADELRKSPYSNLFTTSIYISRDKLCLNNEVLASTKKSKLNGKCASISTECKVRTYMCPYYEKFKHSYTTNSIDKVTTDELIKYGKDEGLCPYYTNLKKMGKTKIVLLTYKAAFSEVAKSLELDFNNSILIIDEGHNVPSAFTLSFDGTLSEQDVVFSSSIYQRLSKTSSIQFVTLRTAIQCIENINIYCKTVDSYLEIKASDFYSNCKIESFNLADVHNAIRSATRSHKKFFSKVPNRDVLHKLMNFMYVLSHSNESTYVIVSKNGYGKSPKKETYYRKRTQYYNTKSAQDLSFESNSYEIKVVSLDYHKNLQKYVRDCRSIAIVGGTLSPTNDMFEEFKKAGAAEDDVKIDSFDHIIDHENFYPIVLSEGMEGTKFNFSYKERLCQNMLSDLGKTIIKLSSLIPAGVLCFFPSYEFLDQSVSKWKKEKLFDQLEDFKKIYIDKKTDKDSSVYKNYKNEILKGKGGIFMTAMNSRVSEGINFSDNLARGVFIVGLPYASLTSPSVYLKINHIQKEKNAQEAFEYYKRCCLTIVNQCSGRAIRHKDDYASLFYLDSRYNKESTSQLISQWIRNRMRSVDSYETLYSNLKEFYRKMSPTSNY